MTTIDGHFGESPASVLALDLSQTWQEFMHYMYLPVRIPVSDPGLTGTPPTEHDGVLIPDRLEFLRPAVDAAMADARATTDHLQDPYVYVTARRGYATPGNPLNRPGWHTDAFGESDLNYVWTDAFPTQFLLADRNLSISDDDQQSMDDMAWIAAQVWAHTRGYSKEGSADDRAIRRSNVRIEDGPLSVMQRLTPYVVHNTPEIPDPGGLRSFFKVSVSTHRYDLIGNSHNYLIGYEWKMFDRQALRNQPGAMQNTDYSGVQS